MSATVIVYVPPLSSGGYGPGRIPGSDHSEHGRTLAAFDGYAAQRGWPKLKNYQDRLETVMQTAGNGDILLLRNLADISERPSVQEAALDELRRRGVRVHVMTLGGEVTDHWSILREVWDSVAPMEQRADQITAEMVQMEADFAAERDIYEEEVVNKLAQKFGAKGMLRSEKPEAPNAVADYIWKQRKARDLTQKQLADKLGISKSQVSRAELTGKADALEEILEFFSTPETKEQTQ